MTQQQMTEEEIKAAGDRVATLITTAKKPLQDAGWLMKQPDDDIINHTAELMKNLPSGWQSRIKDLNNKMLAWLEAKQTEAAATKNISALRQRKAEMEQASLNNRARFRELLAQNGGTVTPDMKAMRAEYLEQQETATELAGLITEKEKQLPVLAEMTGCKANAYLSCHESITDDRIDVLLDDFFMLNGVELSSLLRMKYNQFERNGSVHAPGVIEGVNDADSLYREFILNIIQRWTNAKLPLMFRDDVISLTGAAPFSGARTDRRKRKIY